LKIKPIFNAKGKNSFLFKHSKYSKDNKLFVYICRWNENVKHSFPNSKELKTIHYNRLGFEEKSNLVEQLMDGNEPILIKGVLLLIVCVTYVLSIWKCLLCRLGEQLASIKLDREEFCRRLLSRKDDESDCASFAVLANA
jgi:hypothetical protein